MPSARELLAHADALMRRNRARAVNTEIPELTEVVTEFVSAPLPTALVDVPELTDAVEEIEIASIAEMPDEDGESSAWLHFDRGDTSVLPLAPDAIAGEAELQRVPEPDAKSARSLIDVAPYGGQGALALPTVAPTLPGKAIAVEEEPTDTTLPGKAIAVEEEPTDTPIDARPAEADNRARWEALGDEIRMRVLQRIDLFTDTGLREQLSAQLQPIVDRASAELVATINVQVGLLLRACIAQAIEREIEKWRKESV